MRSEMLSKLRQLTITHATEGERAALHIRWAYYLILIVLFVSLAVSTVEYLSNSTLRDYTPHFVSIIVLLLLTLTVGRYLRAAFERIVRSERELAERNRELQQQVMERQKVEVDFDRFFTMSVDMFAVATTDAYFKQINPAFERVLGYTTAEMLARPFLDFVHPDDLAATRDAINQLRDNYEITNFENRYRCKSGEYKWIAWSSRPLDGMIYAVARDVTDRKLAEEMLRVKEEKYRTLFENTGLFTLIYDRDGTVLLANQTAAETLGHKSPDDIIGKSVRELIEPDHVDTYIARMKHVIDTNQSLTLEDEGKRSSGRKWHYVTMMHPLPDGEGRPVAVQVIGHDVTALKEAEQERFALVLANEQQEFELALANEKAEFLADFLSTFSHDLKTPLTVMNTSLYLLERAPDPVRQQEKIRQIQAQLQRLDKLIQDTFLISRLEYMQDFQREPVNVHNLLTSLVQDLRPRAEKKRLQTRSMLEADSFIVQGDADQLNRAFMNLLENAINYTPEDGSVEVQTHILGNHLHVVIRDTGIGIAPDDLPQVFDRFFRSRRARDMEESGTGLGLAIVKKVMDRHAFPITVESTVGEGTTFSVQMPLS